MKYLNMIRTVTAVMTFSFLAALPANANNIEVKTVKVTPLGSHNGEFCRDDRALIFEDPNGTRILYDPGHTVIGAADSRLRKIHVVLVTHLHGDHVGDWHYPRVNFRGCGERVDQVYQANDLPNTNAAKIALAKKAVIVTGSKMPKFGSGMQDFFKRKLEALDGDPKKSKQAPHKVGGVTITTVPAVHPNPVVGGMIGGELGSLLSKAKLTAYVGPATGYVLKFSNGLAVYLSGDTSITAEQDTLVRQHYRAKLVVMNISNPYPTEPTTEPNEAVQIIKLIKPVSVIVSHAREAATIKGKVIPGTITDKFIKAIDTNKGMEVKVHVPLSGITMEFDVTGNCVAGC